MSMNEFRRLAAKIDQQMQQLAAQGVSEAHAIINRMMGYAFVLAQVLQPQSDQEHGGRGRSTNGNARSFCALTACASRD